jgi:hypothetical protein
MNYKVLYIDDEINGGRPQIEAIKDALGSNGLLEVKLVEVGNLDVITNRIKQEKADGVILDLQLDHAVNSHGERVTYKAPTLAQNIREKSTEDNLLDIPIILCSTQQKIENLYKRDISSHDLFDMRFHKDLTDYNIESVKINALINGYKTIREVGLSIDKLLAIDQKSIEPRIYSNLLITDNLPAHNIAQVILKDLIYMNGPLIDEELLAARLGVETHDSTAWVKLKDNYLANAKYKGIFSDGWNRWWMHEVLALFQELTGKNLAIVDAKERVKLLIEKTGLKDIKCPEKIEKCNSFKFWTICKGYNRPLDPREGFKIIMPREPKAWQEYEYISLEAALEREGFEEKGIKLHPSEIERFELSKESLK